MNHRAVNNKRNERAISKGADNARATAVHSDGKILVACHMVSADNSGGSGGTITGDRGETLIICL
jgi:hypothetical protein